MTPSSTITGSLNAIDLRGRDGRLLRDKWFDGPSALLGIGSAGFPNLFMINGPGSPSVLANTVLSIEPHVDLMISLLDHGRETGRPPVEAQAAAVDRWAAHVAQIVEGTVAVQGNSWFRGADIPGKPRVFMPYAAGLGTFIDECADLEHRGWEGSHSCRGRSTRPADLEHSSHASCGSGRDV